MALALGCKRRPAPSRGARSQEDRLAGIARHGGAIDAWWCDLNASRPEPTIFWGFIDDARNAAIKEYDLHAGQGITIFTQPLRLSIGVAGEAPTTLIVPVPSSSRPPENSYPMTRGPFVGRDQREVIAQAIAWWQEELDAVDAAAVALATGKKA